jgi:O-antigen/teichoic acid export membrane protein
MSAQARFRQWLVNVSAGRLFRSAAVLLAGNTVASGLDFLSLAITARVLGPSWLGLLVLVRAYVTVISRFLDLQSWQLLIAYGAQALERRDAAQFKRLVKFGVLLDAGTAVLGALVGVSIAHWVGARQGWEPVTTRLAMLYSLVLLVNISSAPKGVLRLFDRFDLLAGRDIATAVIKLIGVAAAAVGGFELAGFAAVWIATEVFGSLLLVWLGRRVLAEQGYGGFLRVPLRGLTAAHPKFGRFILATNANGVLKTVTEEVDTLLVGGVLGTAGAGLYKIAKQFSKVISELVGPLYQVVYPELARLWARGEVLGVRRLVIRSGLLTGAGAMLVWLVVLFAGRQLLDLAFGSDFVAAYDVLVWYMLAVVVSVVGFGLHPSLVAAGRPDISLAVYTVTTMIYVPVLAGSLQLWTLAGAGIAYFIYRVAWWAAMLACQDHVLRRRAPAVAMGSAA